MDTVYRVYFSVGEDGVFDLDDLLVLINQHLEGATILMAHGVWMGEIESTLVVEYLGASADAESVRRFAEAAKRFYGQECVLIASHAVALEQI